MASSVSSISQGEMLDDHVIETWVPQREGDKPDDVNVLALADTRCMVIGAGPEYDVKLFVDELHPGPCDNYGAFQSATRVKEQKAKGKKNTSSYTERVPEHFVVKTGSGYSILVTHEGHDYAVVPDAGPAATKAYANYDGTLFQFFKIATALKNAKLAAAPVTDASMDIGLLVVKQTSTDQRSGQKKGGKPTAGSGTTTPVGTPMTRVVSGSGSLPLTQLPNPKAAVSGDFTAPLQKLKTAAAPEDAAEQAAMQSAHAKCYSSQICLPIEIMTTAPDYRHGVFSMRQISQSVVDEYALQLVSNPFSMLPVILAAVVARGDGAFPNTEIMMTQWAAKDFIANCSGPNSPLQLVILGGNHISQAILKAGSAMQGSDKTQFLSRVKVTLLLNPTVAEAIAFSLHDNTDRDKRIETTQLDLFIVARQTFIGAGMPKKNTTARLTLYKECRLKGLGKQWEDKDWAWKLVCYDSPALDKLLMAFKKSDIAAAMLKAKQVELKSLRAKHEANLKAAKKEREKESVKAKSTPFAAKTDKSGSAKKRPKTDVESALEKTIQETEAQVAELKLAKLIGFSITNIRSIIEAPEPDVRNRILEQVADRSITMAEALTEVKDLKLTAKFSALVLRYKMDTCPFDEMKDNPEACYAKLVLENPVALSKANLVALNSAVSLKGKTATIIKKPLESHDQAVREMITGLRWQQSEQLPAGHASQFHSFNIASAGSEGVIRVHERVAADSDSFLCDMTGVTTLLAIPSEAGAVVSNEVLVHVIVQALARVPMNETSAERVIMVERSLADMHDFATRFGTAVAAYGSIAVHQLTPIDGGHNMPMYLMVFVNRKTFTCDRTSYLTVNTGKSFPHQLYSPIMFNAGSFGLHQLLNLRPPFGTGLPIVVAVHLLALYYAIGNVWSLFAGDCSWCVAAAMLHPVVHVLSTDNKTAEIVSGLAVAIGLYDDTKGARAIRDQKEQGEDAFTPENAKDAFLSQREQVFYVVPKDHRLSLGGCPSPAKKGKKGQEDGDKLSLEISEET